MRPYLAAIELYPLANGFVVLEFYKSYSSYTDEVSSLLNDMVMNGKLDIYTTRAIRYCLTNKC